MTFYSTSVVMKSLKGPLKKKKIYTDFCEKAPLQVEHILQVVLQTLYGSESFNYVIIIVKIIIKIGDMA